jgi:prepilin-type N-terminal cleavage/methylation domain-containing protein
LLLGIPLLHFPPENETLLATGTDMRNGTAQSGVTLIELAIVLVILGLLVGVGVTVGGEQLEAARRSATIDRLTAMENALSLFVAANRRLPCPDSATAPDGLEDRQANGTCGAQTSGILPWITLGVPEAATLDGWYRRLTYRVYDNLRFGLTRDNGMDMSGCDPAAAAEAPDNSTATSVACSPSIRPTDWLEGKGLRVVDAAGTLVMDPGAASPSGAAYVLVSHGQDRLGAYTRDNVYTGIPTALLERPNRNSLALATDRPTGFSGFVDDREAYAVDDDTIYFDDLVRRPSILHVADSAALGPRAP